MTNQSHAEQNTQAIVESDPFAPEPGWTGGGDFSRPKDDHGFWNLASEKQFRPLNVEAMLKDPEVQRELARKDPALRAALIEEEMGKIAEEFRRRNPAYHATNRNYEAIVRHLAAQYLQADWLDIETSENRLYDAGKWTVDYLTQAYKSLLKAGKLDVPKGTRRALTKQEQLELIAQIRLGDFESAIVNYIQWCLNDSSIEYDSPTDILAKNPELASEASCFVFYHSRAGEIDPTTFAEFKKAKLRGHQILTVHLLNKAWESWVADRRRGLLFRDIDENKQQTQPKPISAKDIDSLDDEEIAKLYRASGREYIRSLR
jgi:hypothetical protein